MRAGLLSDPRVIALLQTRFIPCMISALNTKGCLSDPRDAETLARYVHPSLDDFDGGEREAFVLPDGTMLGVFLSLRGDGSSPRDVHYTREGRRSESAVSQFRNGAAVALERVDGDLPGDWDAVWAGTDERVRRLAATPPRWPEPEVGEPPALRVFVRNSYRMYDDLCGAELVRFTPEELATWLAGLDKPGATGAPLPESALRRLVRAMVPRGQVAPPIADSSIAGALQLTVETVTGDRIEGRVEGSYTLAPEQQAEAGLRGEAGCLFRSTGRIRGRFTLDARTRQFVRLRAATTDVDFAWLPRHAIGPDDFPPRHAVALQWVAPLRSPVGFAVESEFGAASSWTRTYLEKCAVALVGLMDDPTVEPPQAVRVVLQRNPELKGIGGRASKGEIGFVSDQWPAERHRYWILAHELTKLFAHHYGGGGGYPSDWWSNGRSPFPEYVSCLVMRDAGQAAAATWRREVKAGERDHELFWELDRRHGFAMFARFFRLLRSDGVVIGEIGAAWPAPDARRSLYTAAYLSIAAGENLAPLLRTARVGKQPEDWKARHPEIAFEEYELTDEDVARAIAERERLFGPGSEAAEAERARFRAGGAAPR